MIEQFQQLYDNSVPITDLKKLDTQEYRSFITKRGYQVKLANVKRHMEFLPHEESFYTFFQLYPTFWIIPCEIPTGEVPGYVLRAFNASEYRTAQERDQLQLAYGWWDFKEYQQGIPIILTEGAKDRDYLAQQYPFTLGLLTSRVSSSLRSILKVLTKKVVFALDKDEAGSRMRVRMRKEFVEDGFQVGELIPPEKDWGTLWDQPWRDSYTKTQLQGIIKKLGFQIS